ncbi:WD40 repeat domain-containing protein [Streptomyces sp. NBC_01314]|uniref:WD40 repeat domain-containing protein n=1 Tax=Streptomyces sp. NBC_01314 TaxID=2903821 RepID=UPI0030891687|nr:WD40 repeat domain-containing protein [Streptomyces sp. NBC_01314]
MDVSVRHARIGTPSDAPHASPQTCVAFSPDNRWFATGGYDGRVVVYDRWTGEPCWTGQHQRLVNGIRFAPNGRWLASVSADKTCRVWDAVTGQIVNLLSRQPDDLNCVSWLSDEALVTVSQDGTGRMWDLTDSTLRDVVLGHADHCMFVDALPDTIATCGEDAVIRIWGADGTRIAELGQAGHAEMCRWSPDGRILAASCDDGHVHLLERDGELIGKIGPYDTAVKSVAWSPDQRHVAIGAYDSTVRIWSVVTGEELVRWSGPHLWPRSLDWAPDGRHLISGTTASGPALLPVPEQLGDTVHGEVVTVRLDPPSTTCGVNHVTSRGDVIALGCDDGAVWLAGAEPRRLPGGDGSLVNTVSLHPDADLVAAGAFSGRVWVSTIAGEPLASVQRSHPINRVAWSPDGSRMAVADYEGTLDIYRWQDNALIPESAYYGHDGAVKDVSWVDDERLLAVSTDRTARLISTSGTLLRMFTGHGELINSGSITRIGSREVLATASRDRTVRVHDVGTGELLTVLVGHDESVKALAWGRCDGRPVLLTGGYDFTARLWWFTDDIESAGSRRLEAHGNAISSVAWSGSDPVTAGWDGRVFRWSISGDDAPRPTVVFG